jgi:hypothetical protein
LQNGSEKVEDISKDWCSKVIMQLENERKVFISHFNITHDQVSLNKSWTYYNIGVEGCTMCLQNQNILFKHGFDFPRCLNFSLASIE